MTQPLRPMTLGEIVDRTFQIYGSRFLAFTAISAITVIAVELLRAADRYLLHVSSLYRPSNKAETLVWNFIVGLGFYHLSCLVAGLTEPSIVKLASGSFLEEECTIVSSVRFAVNRWRSYLWIAILKVSVILLLPEIAFMILAIGVAIAAQAGGLFSSATKWALPLLGAFVVLVASALFLWLGTCLSLALPATALEGRAGLNSLHRSWAITKGTRARVGSVWFTVFVALWVLTWASEFLLGQLMFFAGRVLHLAEAMRHLYPSAVFLLATAIYVLIGPIYPIAITLFYYDQRIRREGYDVERMMDAAGLNPPPAPQPAEASMAHTNPEASEA
ncbi:MAG: hypothetical protein ABR987_17020 [Terracidiphilus sp.]|jgi:hypothetical protein